MAKILIYGDSQTGRTGKELEKLLKDQGHTVTRKTNSGKSTEWLSEHIPKGQSDKVYLFSGGNDGSVQANALRALLSAFENVEEVFYFGPPPATLITDLPFAKKMWGSAKSADKFFPQTAEKREKKNTAYKKIAAEFPNVVFVDFRDAPTSNKIKQPSGVYYPSQRDGIHTGGQTAKEVAEYALAPAKKSKSPTLLYAGIAVVAFILLRRRG
jgi:lysophospholipase L1-like esterase